MKTKDQLQKTVDGLQESLSKAQSELSALAKPECVFGQIITLKAAPSLKRIALYDSDGILKAFSTKDVWQSTDMDSYNPTSESIFDDLAALAQPLEEFGVCAFHVDDRIFKAYITKYNTIDITCYNWSFNLIEAAEIHTNLGRLIATAKRKAAKE